MLGTRVTKYYHVVRIRDEKKRTTHIIFTWKSFNKYGKRQRGKSRKHLLSWRNYKISKYNERQITLSLATEEY